MIILIIFFMFLQENMFWVLIWIALLRISGSCTAFFLWRKRNQYFSLEKQKKSGKKKIHKIYELRCLQIYNVNT